MNKIAITNQKSKRIFTALVIIEFFNGISAIAGGFGLMSDPTAVSLGMDTAWLKGTPFNSYLIPGIVLFTVNGLGNTLAAILSIRKYRYLAEIAIFFGAIMMIWIIFQVIWMGYMSFLQPLYFITGLTQLLLGLRIRTDVLKD